ncbi:hypothetical protein ACYOEI_15275, partial [Singulisphaera rosea]
TAKVAPAPEPTSAPTPAPEPTSPPPASNVAPEKQAKSLLKGGIHLPQSISTQLELEDVDVAQIIAKVQFMVGFPFPIPVTGRLSLKADATIPLGTLRDIKGYAFHGDLTLNAASIDRVDFNTVSARLDLADGVVELKDLRGRLADRPDGVKIAAFFITAIVAVSLISRVWRTLELRVDRVELDGEARRFIAESGEGDLHLVANHPDARDEEEYEGKDSEAREDFYIPAEQPILFLEIYVRDSSDFSENLKVRGVDVGGYRVLRAEATAIPNAIAALALYLRDETGRRPHVYFNWTEGNPLLYLIRYVLSGRGDIAPITREVLREAEPDKERRPAIHAGI